MQNGSMQTRSENIAQETNTLSLEFIYRQISTGHINLAVDYQRDVVWDVDRQSALINSLYFGYYVFPVLLSRRGPNQPLVCIDGKQRLTSVLKFFNNEIPMVLQDTKMMYYYSAIPPIKRVTDFAINIFTTEMKLTMEAKGLPIVTFTGLDLIREKEIFQRIQNGMPLTSGEKLKAVTCAATIFANDLTEKYFKFFEKLVPRSRANDSLLFLRAITICCGNIPMLHSTKFKTFIAELQIGDALQARTKRIIGLTLVLINKGFFAEQKLSGMIAVVTVMIIVDRYNELSVEELIPMATEVMTSVRTDMKEMHIKWYTVVQKHICPRGVGS